MHDEFNINRGIPVHFEPAPPLTQRPDSCVGIFQFQSFHVLFKGLIVKDHTNMLLNKIYYSFVAMNVKFPRNKCISGACFRSARNSLYFRESSTTTRRVSNKLWKGVLSRVVCFHYPSKSTRDCHQ